MFPWRVKSQRLGLVAAFSLGVSSAVCTRHPPTAFMLGRFRLAAWSSVHACLLRLRTEPDSAPVRLPAHDPGFHVSEGALLPMPAWVWRDVRFLFFFFFFGKMLAALDHWHMYTCASQHVHMSVYITIRLSPSSSRSLQRA